MSYGVALQEAFQYLQQKPLEPEVAAEALRRARLLRPQRATVLSVKREGHLAVLVAHPKTQELPPLELVSQAIEAKELVLRGGERGWQLCLPLPDRNGQTAGVLYAERGKGRLETDQLELLLQWARKPAAPPMLVTPQRQEPFRGVLRGATRVTLLTSLSVMLDAGVTLNRALRHLAEHAEDFQCASLCRSLAVSIEEGRSFSQAAARFPGVFGALHLGMLRVAERTGGLDGALRGLARYEEKRLATERRVRSALGYPLLLLLMCFAAVTLAPPYVLEGHFQLIRDLKVEPPLLTRALMSFSAFLRTPWPYLGLALSAWATLRAARRLQSDPERVMALTRWLLRVPSLGPLLRTYYTTRFARALSVQLEAGLMVTQALECAGEAVSNPLIRRVGIQSAQGICQGQSLAGSLKQTGFFSPLFISIVHSGEQVGEVGRLVRWLADMGEDELDTAIEKLVCLLEPAVMAGLGLVVGTMVIATLMPLSQALAHI